MEIIIVGAGPTGLTAGAVLAGGSPALTQLRCSLPSQHARDSDSTTAVVPEPEGARTCRST